MQGILVYGDNHFIVDGPEPEDAAAVALARHWTVIEIGSRTPAELQNWRIVSRALRQNLAWAVSVAGETETHPAVKELLEELVARGLVVRTLKGL